MKKIIAILVSVIFTAIALLLIGREINRRKPITIHCDECDISSGINPYGRLTFNFSRDIDPTALDAVLEINPFIDGAWEWLDERSVRWSADKPMPSHLDLTFSFSPGIIGQKDEEIREFSRWDFEIRPAQILVLQSAVETGQEIFLFNYENNSNLEQLTFTEGKVYDYAPSPDGELVAFSAENDQNGYDLWTINRDGSDMHKILDCGTDHCTAPVWSPAAQSIAFTREIVADQSKDKITGMWIFDLETSESSMLFEEVLETAFNPVWSPDGVWLSVWSDVDASVRLLNLVSGELVSLESAQGNTGCWSADSKMFYYADLAFIQAAFHHVIRQVDFEQNTIETIIGKDDEAQWLSYDNPQCNPVDNLIALSIQPNMKIPGKTVAVIDLDTLERTSVKEDLTLIPSNLSWTPAGDKLLFQMNRFNENDEMTVIWIWDRTTNQAEPVLEGGYAPSWLP